MKKFSFTTSSELNGILKNLPDTSYTLKNSTGVSPKDRDLSNIIDHETTKYWCSADSKWQYFRVYFNDVFVSLTSYFIQSGEWSHDFPQKWSVSGFDGRFWHNVSNVENSGIVKARDFGNYMTFNHNFFKAFEVIHTGPNAAGTNYFCVCNFEMFGTITKYIPRQHTQCRRIIKQNMFEISLTILTSK